MDLTINAKRVREILKKEKWFGYEELRVELGLTWGKLDKALDELEYGKEVTSVFDSSMCCRVVAWIPSLHS